MGMDQNFYIAKKTDIAPFVKSMRMFFKDTNYGDYDRYNKIYSSIEMEEIGYARKNYFLQDLIINTVPQASRENAGWTSLDLEDLTACIKVAADSLVDDDNFWVPYTIILLGEVAQKFLDYGENHEDYGILYSADW